MVLTYSERHQDAGMAERRGDWHYGEELEESAEAMAEKLIEIPGKAKNSYCFKTEAQGMDGKGPESAAKGAVFKVKLTERLRAETSVTLRWIAQRLQMGTRGHLSHLLYWRSERNKIWQYH